MPFVYRPEVGGLLMPLVFGRLMAFAFSEVTPPDGPPVALKEALSFPGMVEDVLRICAAPTALCYDDDFMLSGSSL